ncbi:MAG: YdcF family protein [Cyclobacteriaceae bacterium]|nr:YdcF family protein [Cyclobacteriaceae bacterium]UYN88412.1 MAG: YdcF family protein [Cyclobacteriaceae bacterium]
MKWVKRVLFGASTAVILVFVAANVWVVKSTETRVFDNADQVMDHRVALVLGTSHKLVGGGANPFFDHRMDRAAELYKLGKIDHFIVSGDNRTKYYNEPVAMRRALVTRGVPSSAITLDYAGLRTLDSVVRSKEIFGQEKILIITQSFHSYRALFISDYYGIDAIAMGAQEPELESALKVRIREYFARAKAVLDLYVLKTNPQHLGEKEEINITS